MHTITSLRKSLGLSTTNQVRNRIEAVRDILEPHLRRGPNNQILLTDDGLGFLRQLQELYDSGLRMNEASDVLRAMAVSTVPSAIHGSSRFAQYRTTQTETAPSPDSSLQAELAFLRTRLLDLEAQLARSTASPSEPPPPAWWIPLREDLDVS
jgi:hypothetical protein